jgi:hypothetical protein
VGEKLPFFVDIYREVHEDSENAVKTKNVPFFMNFSNFNKNGNFFSDWMIFIVSLFRENETLASFTTSVVKGELNGTKVNVINGKNANLFLILAKNKFSHVNYQFFKSPFLESNFQEKSNFSTKNWYY